MTLPEPSKNESMGMGRAGGVVECENCEMRDSEAGNLAAAHESQSDSEGSICQDGPDSCDALPESDADPEEEESEPDDPEPPGGYRYRVGPLGLERL